MPNSNEEQKKETKPIKQNPKVAPDKQSNEQKSISSSKNNVLFSGIAIFIAIVAIIISIWAIQRNHYLQKQLDDEQTNLTAEVNQIKQKQITSQEQVDTHANNTKKAQMKLQNKLDNLNKQVQIAMNQRLYQNQDWLLLKARYYLELAQINAHWSDNYNAAISLLQQADNLLEQLPATKMFEVRQAIAKEIAQLKAIPTLDIAGLLSQLDAAQTSVSNLTIHATIDKNESEKKSSVENETQKNANTSAWQTRLQESVNLLEKMVVIRRDDENIKPLMSPLYESILRESIRLNLQQAQWAILNNNPIVYQLALKQAILNLKRTFNKTAQETTVLLKQLNDLQQIKITQEKPVIELALPLLNRLIDTKELLVNPINNGGKGEN